MIGEQLMATSALTLLSLQQTVCWVHWPPFCNNPRTERGEQVPTRLKRPVDSLLQHFREPELHWPPAVVGTDMTEVVRAAIIVTVATKVRENIVKGGGCCRNERCSS